MPSEDWNALCENAESTEMPYNRVPSASRSPRTSWYTFSWSVHTELQSSG